MPRARGPFLGALLAAMGLTIFDRYRRPAAPGELPEPPQRWGLEGKAHLLLGALDVSRTDIRLDEQGNPRVMEINTLPGLTPDYSDLCLQSKAEGIRYEDLILEILYLGASRWGMVEPRDLNAESNHRKKS